MDFLSISEVVFIDVLLYFSQNDEENYVRLCIHSIEAELLQPLSTTVSQLCTDFDSFRTLPQGYTLMYENA